MNCWTAQIRKELLGYSDPETFGLLRSRKELMDNSDPERTFVQLESGKNFRTTRIRKELLGNSDPGKNFWTTRSESSNSTFLPLPKHNNLKENNKTFVY